MEVEATNENRPEDQENNEDMEDLASESADDVGDEADDLDEVKFWMNSLANPEAGFLSTLVSQPKQCR